MTFTTTTIITSQHQRQQQNCTNTLRTSVSYYIVYDYKHCKTWDWMAVLQRRLVMVVMVIADDGAMLMLKLMLQLIV
jgi:hypothetical protein